MADNRTMAQMLQAPIEGYEDAIVVPPINANNFELKQPLINLVQSNKFTGRQDPHNHLRFFNKVTSTFRHPEVPNTSRFSRGYDDHQMKHEMKALVVTTPATVKAVEEVCVTCGSNHNFNHCPLTRGGNDFPVFHDNIQQFQQTAAVGNFLQRNQPSNLASQMKPPGFNQPNVQNNQNRYQGTNSNSNQNRGNNFNQNHQNHQGQVFQPPTNQPPVYQVPPYQAPTPQIQGVSKTDFENYVKANDAVLKNVQNQGQNLQNQMANVTSLLTSLCNNFKNSASTSNSGTLPSQTVTNPRQQINAITTRSGKTLEEPSTPLVPTPDVSIPSKEPEQNPETSTEKVQNPHLDNTAHVPPPREEDSIFIEIPKPKAKKTVNLDPNSPNPNSYQSKLTYPERMKVKENDKPSAQHSRFLKMFKQLRLEIGLKDALVEMPKFNKWLGLLLRNKEKLEEITIMTVNAECSAIIMNKVPEKLEDLGKFLIPCALQELNRTSALADSGASINLLPHSIYKKLGLEALTPTRMTLELANRSITHRWAIARGCCRRPFLRTAKALIDLYEETLTLRVGKEELVYYADKSEKNKNKHCVHAISIIDFSKDDPFSGSTTTHSNDLFSLVLLCDDASLSRFRSVENDDSKDEVNESPNLDHQDDPSIPRPPPEPPDIEKCFKPEAGILITKEFKGVSKPHDFMADILPTLPTLVSDTDISEITRKPSKTSKHGHENGRVYKIQKQSHEKVNPQSSSITTKHEKTTVVANTTPIIYLIQVHSEPILFAFGQEEFWDFGCMWRNWEIGRQLDGVTLRSNFFSRLGGGIIWKGGRRRWIRIKFSLGVGILWSLEGSEGGGVDWIGNGVEILWTLWGIGVIGMSSCAARNPSSTLPFLVTKLVTFTTPRRHGTLADDFDFRF
ncbi:reverse transcriptase domain-containing protein [Tanacetum coccineum]